MRRSALPAWLVRHANEHGEWCITDLRRTTRVCAYNHEAHGGTHVHARGRRTIPVDIATAEEAERIVRAYAADHDAYEPGAFRKEVERWRSASTSG